MSAEDKAAAEAEKVRLAVEKEAKRLAEEARRRAEEEEERARKVMEAQLVAMQQIEDLRKAEEVRGGRRADERAWCPYCVMIMGRLAGKT